MRINGVFFTVLLCLMLFGCAGLKRGMDGNTYYSSAYPNIAITVSSLPLRTAGAILPAVTTADSLGGITLDAWIAVYGGKTPQEPMAIISQATLPSAYLWDDDLMRAFSVDQGRVVFDGVVYQACTYIVSGKGDAFAPLVSVENPDAIRWVVRRFAARMNFNTDKITMEYREELPKHFVSLDSLPHGGNDFLREFAQRAENAFAVNTPGNINIHVRTGYPEGIRVRYLNTNFFGTISRYSTME